MESFRKKGVSSVTPGAPEVADPSTSWRPCDNEEVKRLQQEVVRVRQEISYLKCENDKKNEKIKEVEEKIRDLQKDLETAQKDENHNSLLQQERARKNDHHNSNDGDHQIMSNSGLDDMPVLTPMINQSSSIEKTADNEAWAEKDDSQFEEKLKSSESGSEDDMKAKNRKKKVRKRKKLDHSKTHAVDEIICEYVGGFHCTCGYNCTTKIVLDSHINYYTKISCLVCNHSFRSISALNVHLKEIHNVHAVPDKIGCSTCDMGFQTRAELAEHRRTMHGTRAGRKQRADWSNENRIRENQSFSADMDVPVNLEPIASPVGESFIAHQNPTISLFI